VGAHQERGLPVGVRGTDDLLHTGGRPGAARFLPEHAHPSRVGLQQPDGQVQQRALARPAAFIGLDLYEGVDQKEADRAVASLEQLGRLVAVLEDLGPVTRLAIRTQLRRGRR